MDVEQIFRPTFEKHRDGTDRSPGERDRVAAVTTYRYLRLGLVILVVALGASLLIQRHDAGCWQGSITAYYYSPVRALFVSAMVAIGVMLIVIKGNTLIEDLLLNLAGVLAPIVAFVPTRFEAACVAGEPLVQRAGAPLPQSIVDDVHNNVGAYLVAGTAALAVGALVMVVEQRRVRTDHGRSQLAVLGVTALILAVGWWLLASDRILELHGKSAALMFVLLALASIANGVWLFRANRGTDVPTSPRWRVHAWAYVLTGGAMIVAGLVIDFAIPDPWAQRTLVLEVVEIGLFAMIWVVQSIERWGSVTQAEPEAC